MVPFMFEGLEKIFTKLLRLVMKHDMLVKANTIMKQIKKEWIADTNNHLENDLVDIGSAAKDLLNKVKISPEKTRKFKGECKTVILDILIKLSEKTPLRFSIIRNASAIVPGNMALCNDICSKRFSTLVDRL